MFYDMDMTNKKIIFLQKYSNFVQNLKMHLEFEVKRKQYTHHDNLLIVNGSLIGLSIFYLSICKISLIVSVQCLCFELRSSWSSSPYILYDSTVPSPSSSSTSTMDPRNKHPMHSNLRSHCKLGLLRMMCVCACVSE